MPSIYTPVTSRSKYWFLKNGFLVLPLLTVTGEEIELSTYHPDASGVLSSGKSRAVTIGNDFVLHAELQDDAGTWHPRHLNMNFFVFIDESDSVHFQSPSENITASSGSFTYDNFRLKALCLGYDGLLHQSEYPLGNFLEVDDGAFKPHEEEQDGTAMYSWKGNSYELEEDSTIFKGKLERNDGGFSNAAIDLAEHISNIGGKLVFKKPQGAWDRDGAWTQFAETFPYASWAVVVAHLAAGNPDQAKRAAARSLYALIVFSATTAGGIVGNGLGLSLGAAFGTAAAMKIEELVGSTIVDAKIAAQLDPVTIQRYLKEVLVNSVAGYVGGALSAKAAKFGTSQASKLVEKAAGKAMSGVKVKLAADAAEQGLSWGTGPSFGYRTNQLVTVLDNVGQEINDPSGHLSFQD
ncbi:hypothetical protein DRE_04371 [Drechslerella stenobrocha 248]|uniref:Cyanovirin-N domain-containing protein n=1 Tax=Drechslerella stenobrocha 248 TaxID=1043628 RepID=W7I277_9PEZI|nr:hypothetical protein DRE_04371 [Drechslerella stenobrocha 248]